MRRAVVCSDHVANCISKKGYIDFLASPRQTRHAAVRVALGLLGPPVRFCAVSQTIISPSPDFTLLYLHSNNATTLSTHLPASLSINLLCLFQFFYQPIIPFVRKSYFNKPWSPQPRALGQRSAVFNLPQSQTRSQITSQRRILSLKAFRPAMFPTTITPRPPSPPAQPCPPRSSPPS